MKGLPLELEVTFEEFEGGTKMSLSHRIPPVKWKNEKDGMNALTNSKKC
jgi:hypothetical protein